MFSLFIISLFLLCSSALFSASETALFSLSRVQVHRLRKNEAWASKKIIECLRKPRDLIVTILFGNELVNVSISIVGAAIISRLSNASVNEQTLIAVAIITPIIMIFGEILPKNLAIHFADKLAPIIIVPIHLFYRMITPMRFFLTFISERVIMALGGNPKEDAPMIMEQEFRRLVDLGLRQGVIDEEEGEIIHNVFEFTDKVAKDIMTPAERIFSLPIDLPYEQMIGEIKSTQYSRVPFYEGDKSNYIGILHVRDLFSFHRRRINDKDIDLRMLFMQPLFVSEATPLEDLLKEFQRAQLHMALVKNMKGKVVGIVTMDDVQKELFGEME